MDQNFNNNQKNNSVTFQNLHFFQILDHCVRSITIGNHNVPQKLINQHAGKNADEDSNDRKTK